MEDGSVGYYFFLQIVLTIAFVSCSQTVTSTRINHEIPLNLLEETVYGKAPPSSSRPAIPAKVQDLFRETHLEKMKRQHDLGDVDCTDLKLHPLTSL